MYRSAFLIVVFLTFGAVAKPAQAGDPNALWHVVHDLCVTDTKITGAPAPCSEVNLQQGYAVLKDLRGATQFLLIPTARVTGIEDDALLTPTSPNYWKDAWEARRLLERRAGRMIPRDDIGLAINSIYGRSQNQLHIHIDCVRPDVRASLHELIPRIGSEWSALDVALVGHRYKARWVAGEDLGSQDPFKLLADGDPGARADMGRETLVVFGARLPDGSPGFVLLSDQADPARNDRGAGEDLLDHKCVVLSGDDETPHPPAVLPTSHTPSSR